MNAIVPWFINQLRRGCFAGIILNFHCIGSGAFLVVEVEIRKTVEHIVGVPDQINTPIDPLTANPDLPFSIGVIKIGSVNHRMHKPIICINCYPRQIKITIINIKSVFVILISLNGIAKHQAVTHLSNYRKFFAGIPFQV